MNNWREQITGGEYLHECGRRDCTIYRREVVALRYVIVLLLGACVLQAVALAVVMR